MQHKPVRRKRKITFVTGNLIEGEHGRYSAYFTEFPELIAEGENIKDAKANLIEALQELLEYRRSKNAQIKKPSDKKINQFELAIA